MLRIGETETDLCNDGEGMDSFQFLFQSIVDQTVFLHRAQALESVSNDDDFEMGFTSLRDMVVWGLIDDL